MRPKKQQLVQRIHITVPPEILARIERYQERNAIPTRSTAIMELVRKGLRMEE